LSSVLSKVRSSLRRAHEVCIGCTHERHATVGGQLAHHPPPVPGRLHDTVTPANPLAAARSAAQSNATPRSQARHRNVRRTSTLES
jgi:hypothetical protein